GGKLQFRELTQQGVDRALAFEACQRRTQRVVHSLAKREMALVRPCDVQRIRPVELVFTPVGGCENRKHQGSASDRVPRDDEVFTSVAVSNGLSYLSSSSMVDLISDGSSRNR